MEEISDKTSTVSKRSSRSSAIISAEDDPEDPVMNAERMPLKRDAGGAEGQSSPSDGTGMDLRYKLEDVPPWYLCIVLGFQHYLTMFGATASIPLILAPALCLTPSSVAVSEILSTLFFVSGIVTLIQTSVGIRLPVIQGGTFSFLVPGFAILSLPKWKCPDMSGNLTETWNQTVNETMINATLPHEDEIWQPRMLELQGAIITASLFQVVIGATGVMGYIMKYIGPLTITPTIALIGLALFNVAADSCASQWGVAIMTIVLIILFSQYLRNVEVPIAIPTMSANPKNKKFGCKKSTYPIFKMFPVILAIMLSWILCLILTVSGALPEDNMARTDINTDVLYQANWFRVPYPFQWGLPTVTLAGTLGMLAGVVAGMLESIGDYYACARMSGAPPPPTHAVNRGILIEGIGCVLSGMWGSGTGSTSYSENIGAIGITKVGSRRVIQSAGVIMIILGMFGKFGALFVTIPTPIVGGIFMTMFGMIAAVGISNLQYVDLNSSRNLFIFGFAMLFGLSVPKWIAENPGIIDTGVAVLDQIISVLLGTSMFLGGTIAFILDNTVPGTLKERGILTWREQLVETDDSIGEKKPVECYEIPFISAAIRRHNWTRYVPVCPTYRGYDCSCRCAPCRKKTDDPEKGDDIRVNKSTVTTEC